MTHFPLVICGPYPLVDATDGYAVVSVRTPHAQTFELVDEQLVDVAETHALEWQQFAASLRDLMGSGWHVQGHAGVYATRACSPAELLELARSELQPGAVVEWCVPDANGGLYALGGLVAGHPAPRETFPGEPLPALVQNDLTGAQWVAGDEHELRAVLRAELTACATWWRAHPQERSDHDAHELPDELDELAAALEHDNPVPASVMEPAGPARLFDRDGHHTRLSVHPVSAIVFAGLLEAVRCYSSLALAPRDGHAAELRRRGEQLAAERGLRPAT